MNKVYIFILAVLIGFSCAAQHCDTLQFTIRGNISKGWKSIEDTLYVIADSEIILNTYLFISVFVDTNGYAHAKELSAVLISSTTSLCVYSFYYHTEHGAFQGECGCEESLFCDFINLHQKEILELYERRVLNSKYTTNSNVPSNHYSLVTECHLHFLPAD